MLDWIKKFIFGEPFDPESNERGILCPEAVVNRFLELSRRDNVGVTHLRMQLFVYYANGVHLAKTGIPLVNRKFVVFTCAPMIWTLYEKLRQFETRDLDIRFLPSNEIVKAGSDADAAIVLVWDNLKNHSFSFLANLATDLMSPWREALSRDGKLFALLDDRDIEKNFEPSKKLGNERTDTISEENT